MSKKKKNKQEGADEWLITYGDIITLLLVFFVLLFALSNLNTEKYQKVATIISTSLSGKTVFPNQGAGSELVDFNLYLREIQNEINNADLKNDVDVKIKDNDIVITGKGDIFFESGSADLTPKIKKFLDAIAPILKTTVSEIEIIGHTDDVPIKTMRFPSNWELSTARACSVVKYFINKQHMNPKRFKASGFAQYKPRFIPIPANRAKNRRIEIILKNVVKKEKKEEVKNEGKSP